MKGIPAKYAKQNWPNFSKNLISKVNKIIRSGKINYTTGPYGKIFEKNFSKYIGNKYSVAICNGTAALEVAIKSLELPKNSEIIVPARSFFSSAACIVNAGFIPIFADIDLKNKATLSPLNKINPSVKIKVAVIRISKFLLFIFDF